jgi:hypothetical protein
MEDQAVCQDAAFTSKLRTDQWQIPSAGLGAHQTIKKTALRALDHNLHQRESAAVDQVGDLA